MIAVYSAESIRVTGRPGVAIMGSEKEMLQELHHDDASGELP